VGTYREIGNLWIHTALELGIRNLMSMDSMSMNSMLVSSLPMISMPMLTISMLRVSNIINFGTGG